MIEKQGSMLSCSTTYPLENLQTFRYIFFFLTTMINKTSCLLTNLVKSNNFVNCKFCKLELISHVDGGDCNLNAQNMWCTCGVTFVCDIFCSWKFIRRLTFAHVCTFRSLTTWKTMLWLCYSICQSSDRPFFVYMTNVLVRHNTFGPLKTLVYTNLTF